MKKSFKSPVMDPPPLRIPEKKKNSYHIGGISVEFPYQPYGTQLAFMGRVISTLDRAQREGHCHALLESPTGTGKSLSLLCSALAWQHHAKLRNFASANPMAYSKPAPEAYVDPIGHGGGFVPESQPSVPGDPQPVPFSTNNKASKKKNSPTIFYASRTHSQITQVIREYKKTTYRVPMAVLASRKHYCTNSHVRNKGNIDEDCKLLLRDKEDGCTQFKNAHKVKGHKSLMKGGHYEVHDIEDLLKVGHQVKGCSYFAARSMADDAQLVFCPYSYILNPIIRKAMEVDIKNAIIILDEAHNIEDMARDAGSMDAEEDVLHKLQVELGQLACENPAVYQPLHEMMEDLIMWMERKKNTLQKHEFQHYVSCWTGNKALRELQEANISQQCFPALQDCATKAFQASIDTESEEAHLTPMSAITLEGLFSSLGFFFSEDGAHVNDYQLAIQKYIKKDGNVASDWTITLNLWCLNPAIVFRNITNLSLSVILTSGTLSPMNSFSSELGVEFGTCLEAPHVIDVDSQLWAAVIPKGPENYPLNASYKTSDGYAFQDALGKSLEKICQIVPGGSLIFFPSYKLMEKLCNRWRQTGQWSRLNAQKPLFMEPRGNQEEFEAALTGYYDAITGKKKPAVGRKRKGKKLGAKNLDGCIENLQNGAAFLAVCRGKASEGIDFSDEKARVVILVGIPFPNVNDIQVAQKKRYNDMYRSSKNLLSGSEWYCQQAFRALNQSAGRCIRHKLDFGAIILLDERFRQERNTMYISKWLRRSIKQYDSFDESMEELKSFFSIVKEKLPKESSNIAQNSEANVVRSCVAEQGEGRSRTIAQQVNKTRNFGQELDSDCILVTSPISVEKYDTRVTLTKSESNLSSPREYIDIECNSLEDWVNSPAPFSKTCYDYTDLTVVQETPDIDVSHNLGYKDETSNSTITHCRNEFGALLPLHTTSSTSSNPGPSKCTNSLTTPEKYVSLTADCLLAETEPGLNSSVNSHVQKRRKSVGSTFVNLIKAEEFDYIHPLTSTSISCKSNSVALDDVKRFELSTSHNSPLEKSSLDFDAEERLQICCSLCKKPLGLPENHFFVSCFIASSSKIYLSTLREGRRKSPPSSTPRTPVLLCNASSVDHQLIYGRTHERDPREGVWCEEDGCVFGTVLCPFCTDSSNCLGVRVIATNTANDQLRDKVLFYRDRLAVMDIEASKEVSMEKEAIVAKNEGKRKLSAGTVECFDSLHPPKTHMNQEGLTPVHVPEKRTYAAPTSIEDFAYVPQPQKSDGWRTTRSKLQLPKRGALH